MVECKDCINSVCGDVILNGTVNIIVQLLVKKKAFFNELLLYPNKNIYLFKMDYSWKEPYFKFKTFASWEQFIKL